MLCGWLVACGDDEGGEDLGLDGGSTLPDGGRPRDSGTDTRDGRAVSDPSCRSAEMEMCTCQRDALCCADETWDIVCDAVAEAWSCGTCDPDGPNKPGDPGWFDPNYRPTGALDGGAGSCVEYRMDTMPSVPDVLIALDRSGSMRTKDRDRFQPAVDGVAAFARDVESKLRVGLMTLPGDCTVYVEGFERAACELTQSSFFGDISCQAGQVKVSPALSTGNAIATQLSFTGPGGASPIAQSLRAARTALAAMPFPGSSQLLFLVTDGAPNCSGGNIGQIAEASRRGQPQAVADTIAAIDELRTAGIRSYVIGFDVAEDDDLMSTLDRLAAAGGTGNTKHYPAKDLTSLQTTLRTLSEDAAACTQAISTPLVGGAALQIKLDGEPLRRDERNGYKLSPDRRTFTLQGTACSNFREGSRHVLFVKAACPVVPRSGADAGSDAGSDAGGDASSVH